VQQLGKMLVLAGVALLALGGGFWLAGALGLRKLPGDLVFRTGGATVIVPIATCLILSALLTLSLWLWQWLQK